MNAGPARRQERDVDALVIGAGAAGCVAARRLALAGHEVLVLHNGTGATRLSSGAFDVGDDLRDDVPGNSSDPLSPSSARAGMLDVATKRLRHPYAQLSAGARAQMDDAIRFFFDATPGLSWHRSLSLNENLVALTQLGTAKRTFAALRHMAYVGDQQRCAVMDLRDCGGVNAGQIAAMLRHVTALSARELSYVTVPVARVFRGPALGHPAHMARALDADESAQERFVSEVETALAGHGDVELALFPAVFGPDLADRLEERTGVPCRALMALPPSAPGQLLVDALHRGAKACGAELVRAQVSSAEVEDGRVTRVHAEAPGLTVRPQVVVLATGRFLGGGLSRDQVGRETVFGLPLLAEGQVVGDRFIGEFTGPVVDSEHEIFRAGIGYDAQLRPVGVRGAKVAHNLFAAGSVLEGYDPARDASGLGVCALTGYLAAGFALEVLDAAEDAAA